MQYIGWSFKGLPQEAVARFQFFSEHEAFSFQGKVSERVVLPLPEALLLMTFGAFH